MEEGPIAPEDTEGEVGWEKACTEGQRETKSEADQELCRQGSAAGVRSFHTEV